MNILRSSKHRNLLGFTLVTFACLALIVISCKVSHPEAGNFAPPPSVSLTIATWPPPPAITIQMIVSTLTPTTTPAPFSSDEAFLDEIEHRAFEYFWQEANPHTGLIKDRANNFGPDSYTVASTAAVGFGLTALCIGQERGWVTREAAYERALMTLRFYRDKMENVHGFYYHFVDVNSGERKWKSEVSSIDSALFLAGTLTIGQCYPGTEVEAIANELYGQADFQWLLTDDGARPNEKLLGHGWKPESGFLPYRWDTYSELMILYLLAMGSPTHPISADSWTAWARPTGTYAGYTTLAQGPLFTHQYSHAWIDFRGQHDRLGYDYFASSVNATLANRQFAIDNKGLFAYDEDIWGLTASDGPDGQYHAYGAPPGAAVHDGTVAPSAAAGSMVFTPDLSTAALRAMYERYGGRLWGRYGFSNAFNVERNWWDKDVIGIDLGITLLMIENHRSELVWRTLMPHPAIQRALAAAGFARQQSEPLTPAFQSALRSLCWVAYAPTNFDPNQGVFPSQDSLRQDLLVLKQAGFTGLVTYGADQPIAQVAEEVGFKGMLLGVWEPKSVEEMRQAQAAAQSDLVIGYVVGNEGLGVHYDYATLEAAMDQLRRATGKPVATTEQIEDYADARLRDLGDWLFPNVHPYWHGYTEPVSAVNWTVKQFEALERETQKPIMFKEVGLPTGGDDQMSEANQVAYYRLLNDTPVVYVRFEAFDQPWKNWAPVEPYWGLFHSDRSPKQVVPYACGTQP